MKEEEDIVTYGLPDDVSVLVATPNYTNLFSSEVHSNHIECVRSWSKWGLTYNWMIVGRTFVHFARSQACQAAIDGGFSHIFWVDDDCMIDPEILPKLLEHDKDVVITPYPMRRSPFEVGILVSQEFYCWKCKHRQHVEDDVTPPEGVECEKCGGVSRRNYHEHAAYRNLRTDDLDKGLISVDGGGTHAMLIKTDILKNARGFKPSLEPDNDSYPPGSVELFLKLGQSLDTVDEQKLIDHYIGDIPDQSLTFEEEAGTGAKPFFIMPKVGTEDMLWCYRAKCKGVEIYCDTDLFANHVSFAPVVTREFTEQAELIKRDPDKHLVTGDQKVVLQKVGDRSRDHTAIRVDNASSLT